MFEIKPGDRYQHFRTGGYYIIIGFATLEATAEQVVIYENEKTCERWVRPVNNFLENVEHESQQVPRFKKLQDAKEALPLYGLDEQIGQDGQPYWDVTHWSGDKVLTLQGGNAPVIILSFLNMSRYEHRGNDYMAGVMAGCIHMHLKRGEEITKELKAPE